MQVISSNYAVPNLRYDREKPSQWSKVIFLKSTFFTISIMPFNYLKKKRKKKKERRKKLIQLPLKKCHSILNKAKLFEHLCNYKFPTTWLMSNNLAFQKFISLFLSISIKQPQKFKTTFIKYVLTQTKSLLLDSYSCKIHTQNFHSFKDPLSVSEHCLTSS